MALTNPSFPQFKLAIVAAVKAKSLQSNSIVDLANAVPTTLTDEQYASLVGLVVACDKAVVPDLIRFAAALAPKVEEDNPLAD